MSEQAENRDAGRRCLDRLVGSSKPTFANGCREKIDELLRMNAEERKELEAIREGIPVSAPKERYAFIYRALLAGR